MSDPKTDARMELMDVIDRKTGGRSIDEVLESETKLLLKLAQQEQDVLGTAVKESIEISCLATIQMLLMADYNLDDTEKFELCYGGKASDRHPDYVAEKKALLRSFGLLGMMQALDYGNVQRLLGELRTRYGGDAMRWVVTSRLYWEERNR